MRRSVSGPRCAMAGRASARASGAGSTSSVGPSRPARASSDPVVMTQEDVYRLFGEIDRLPTIMEPRVGRWRAWPIAKMPLVWHLMQAREPSDPINNVSLWSKLAERLPRYAADVSVALQQYRRIRKL